MSPPPNELYSAISFLGFVKCVIPFYWQLEAWNTGSCLYLIWTGLGCLLQFVNSVVWNKNITNRAPVYCDISTSVQVALNVAVPACSLCVNRRLYKITTMKAVMVTYSEKRRAVIQDLLICVGLPILQIITHYVVSPNRYNIYEDFGPSLTTALTPLTFILFSAWPLVIGSVSLFYCSMIIHTLYKHNRQLNQILSSFHGLTRGRYIRMMVLFSAEMLGIIPLGTYFMVSSAKMGVKPWKSWADMHSNYSEVVQVPSSIWKKNSSFAVELELFRWSVVACAFNFFILFGTADEARQHYRLFYAWLTGRTTRADPPAAIPLYFPDTTKPTMFADSDVDKICLNQVEPRGAGNTSLEQ